MIRASSSSRATGPASAGDEEARCRRRRLICRVTFCRSATISRLLSDARLASERPVRGKLTEEFHLVTPIPVPSASRLNDGPTTTDHMVLPPVLPLHLPPLCPLQVREQTRQSPLRCEPQPGVDGVLIAFVSARRGGIEGSAVGATGRTLARRRLVCRMEALSLDIPGSPEGSRCSIGRGLWDGPAAGAVSAGYGWERVEVVSGVFGMMNTDIALR